jgi:hypothetical protein
VAQRPELIRSEIEELRRQMAATVDALKYKTHLGARMKGWAAAKKDALVPKTRGRTPH